MNLTMLLEMAADGFGDRVVVGRSGSGLTAAELKSAALRGAEQIEATGADAVVYLAINGPAFPVAMFAAAYAGVPLVPLNFRLGAEQLDSLLAQHPGALAIGDAAAHSILGKHRMRAFTTERWLELTTEGPAPADRFVESEAPAVIIYTSGTTSAPKGVLLRHDNLTSYVVGSVDFMSADAGQAALVSVPPYHIAAVANVITNLYAGRRSIVLERFEPAEWLEIVRREKVTNALVVPTMLARIVDCEADKSVPSLRSLAYGGAPMPANVIHRALESWPEVDFVNAYGLTETSSTVAVLTPEDHREAMASSHPSVRERLSSVGRPVPGVEIQIRDAEDRVLAPGEKGRICVRGAQVSAEYAGIGRLVDADGWFDTRDEGFVDEEGYVFVGGRRDDTIIRGAENIAPAEIEEVLFRHPAIADVAVIGVPDEEWGQRIVAVAVQRDGQQVDSEELREFVRGTLRSSKTPDEIVFWTEMPRTETGKLVRRQVVARFEQQHVG
ncbi:class I adenylate-forming enzyme family protein [Nocardioides sp. BP30]|uniref:class I adenylate-forming enzyme family protein n=1 Tax=Nocardioides sp. BP30 TaxID=3036374 RepID=UPI00246859B0|nr:class I adenylate-forming enzyme family protein [Nocardioides sp. BP30]WGL54023.1 class I adenylate-forming enzyme family protein [Nocardioides sp. BP30]